MTIKIEDLVILNKEGFQAALSELCSEGILTTRKEGNYSVIHNGENRLVIDAVPYLPGSKKESLFIARKEDAEKYAHAIQMHGSGDAVEIVQNQSA
jgi:hypothetical protein